MLTLSDIRDTASSRIYRKGLELQSYKLVKNFEYSIFEESDNSVVADMQGELCGDFDTDYTVSAVVDESYSEVREWRCSCEESWDGMCSHCVALLVEYLQKRKAKEVLEIKWKKKEWTDYKYDGRYFIIVKNKKWVGFYNLDSIISIAIH